MGNLDEPASSKVFPHMKQKVLAVTNRNGRVNQCTVDSNQVKLKTLTRTRITASLGDPAGQALMQLEESSIRDHGIVCIWSTWIVQKDGDLNRDVLIDLAWKSGRRI